MTRFPQSIMRHLERIGSDHRPILLLRGQSPKGSSGPKPFRFMAAWMVHNDFGRVLSTSWERGHTFPVSSEVLTGELTNWNKVTFGHILHRKRKLARRLRVLEAANERVGSVASREEESAVRKEMETTLCQEHIMFFQKSRAQWVVHGDKNSRFNHLSTLKRRSFNRIRGRRNNQGLWVFEEVELCKMARDFYVVLYQEEEGPRPSLPGTFPKLRQGSRDGLQRSISREETWVAVKSMGGFNAREKMAILLCFTRNAGVW
ncbi:unnamed protein product [Linum trigynum]|uniref:Uncharacterized protein n=1 Tax=Linum trigynum TaxID=586398 RepID=A0AAV2DAQ9_9ROSI